MFLGIQEDTGKIYRTNLKKVPKTANSDLAESVIEVRLLAKNFYCIVTL